MSFNDLAPQMQNTILNAACEAFAKHGYRKASMADIAALAKVSKSVLFKYFSTKENLYEKVFLLASRSIKEADRAALEQGGEPADLFDLMRRSARSRLSMFKAYPWIYRFSYTAFFDDDPYVQMLVERESERPLDVEEGRQSGLDASSAMGRYYDGLRKDISTEHARQLIRWVSMGYLEEKLNRGDIDPDELEAGYKDWIGIFETILKDPRQLNAPDCRKEGDDDA